MYFSSCQLTRPTSGDVVPMGGGEGWGGTGDVMPMVVLVTMRNSRGSDEQRLFRVSH